MEEAEKLNQALGREAEDIIHIGSTAVPGLSAKPIIDIMVCVKGEPNVEDIAPELEPLGYVYVQQEDEPRRYFFRKGMPRTHHVHVVEQSSGTPREHVRLRNILRGDPEIRREYERLKTRLAEEFPDDRASYSEGKDEFIREVLQEYTGQY